VAFFYGLFQHGGDAFLVDVFNGGGGYLQGDPHIVFRDVEFFYLEVGVKLAFGLLVGEGNVVAHDGLFPGEVANS